MQNTEFSYEKVLVINRDYLPKFDPSPGIDFHYNKYLKNIDSFSFFMNRKKAEENYQYKQIIPYSIIFFKNNIIVYRRSYESVEKRLLGMLSIGFGGHISNKDKSYHNIIFEASLREINEELKISGEYSTKIIGILNDDTNDVGKVHLGIIFKLALKDSIPKIKEKAIENLEIVELGFLKKNFQSFEGWSQICINNIKKISNF